MAQHMSAFALLVLLVVLAAAASGAHKSAHAAKRGSRTRGAHRASKSAAQARQGNSSCQAQLVPAKALRVVEFDFGDDGTLEQQLLDSGRYDPKAINLFGIAADVSSRGRMFATTPLARRGIPLTLSTGPLDGPTSPKLKPYPSFEVHRTTEDTITDCSSQLVSIIEITKSWADDDTLHAIDSGVLDITTSPKHVCQPKIVSFDLRTDEIIKITIIENAACNSLYTHIWVDACPSGSLTAYSSDTVGNRLTVTDLTTGVSKHQQSQYFHPKPGYFFTEAGGPPFYMPYGICGSTADDSCDGKFYFQAYASNTQGVLDKQVIRDASDGEVLDIKNQVRLPGEVPGPTGTMALDPTSQLLFFPSQDELAIYAWNTSKPHHPDNFCLVAQDNNLLQFVSSLVIEIATQRLYVNINRFTTYLANATNYSEINYRLLYINLSGIQC